MKQLVIAAFLTTATLSALTLLPEKDGKVIKALERKEDFSNMPCPQLFHKVWKLALKYERDNSQSVYEEKLSAIKQLEACHTSIEQ